MQTKVKLAANWKRAQHVMKQNILHPSCSSTQHNTQLLFALQCDTKYPSNFISKRLTGTPPGGMRGPHWASSLKNITSLCTHESQSSAANNDFILKHFLSGMSYTAHFHVWVVYEPESQCLHKIKSSPVNWPESLRSLAHSQSAECQKTERCGKSLSCFKKRMCYHTVNVQADKRLFLFWKTIHVAHLASSMSLSLQWRWENVSQRLQIS